MKTRNFTSNTSTELAEQVDIFLGRIEVCKHTKYEITYTLRKDLISLSCYYDNSQHHAILVYDENIKL